MFYSFLAYSHPCFFVLYSDHTFFLTEYFSYQRTAHLAASYPSFFFSVFFCIIFIFF